MMIMMMTMKVNPRCAKKKGVVVPLLLQPPWWGHGQMTALVAVIAFFCLVCVYLFVDHYRRYNYYYHASDDDDTQNPSLLLLPRLTNENKINNKPFPRASPFLLSLSAWRARYNIVAGHILALNPSAEHVLDLERSCTRWLGIHAKGWRAVNGTEAMKPDNVARLPLYTRMTLATGRHDHMQLGAPAMLGCLMGHIRIWSSFLDTVAAAAAAAPRRKHHGDGADNNNNNIDTNRIMTIMVLEEDALIDAVSAERLSALLKSVEEDEAATGDAWDILMLDAGHITIDGPMRRVGALGMTWAPQKNISSSSGGGVVAVVEPCVWMGTRGYLLRASGARKLMRHANELTVQVDALIGLVATFDPSFRMYWPRSSVAHQQMFQLSIVQDRCIKCHMPQSASSYAFIFTTVSALSAFGTLFIISRRLRDRTRKLLGLFVATNFVVPKLIDWAVARIKEGETVDNNNNKGAKKWIGRTLETVAMPLFKTAWFYFNTIQLNGDIRREIDELRDACHLPKSSVSDNSSDIID